MVSLLPVHISNNPMVSSRISTCRGCRQVLNFMVQGKGICRSHNSLSLGQGRTTTQGSGREVMCRNKNRKIKSRKRRLRKW
jgi:hypothetical protein